MLQQVVVDKETSRKRGFAFVTYKSFQSVENALKKGEHSLKDKVVEVLRPKSYCLVPGPGA